MPSISGVRRSPRPSTRRTRPGHGRGARPDGRHARGARRRRHARSSSRSAPGGWRSPLSARGIAVHGIELSPHMARAAARQAGSRRGAAVTIGDMTTTRVAGDVPARLPGGEHDHERHDPGRAGRGVRERRRAPRAGRLLRGRGDRARSSAACLAARSAGSSRSSPITSGSRPSTTGRPDRVVPSLDRAWTVASCATPRRTATCGRPSSTSWPARRACDCATGGPTGTARPFTSDSTSHVSVFEKR